MNKSRYVAATALQKVTSDGGYSNIVLNSVLKKADLSKEDTALCTNIFYGTLDRMVTVDYYLKSLIKTPLKKLKPFTLAVMRTAVYQIKYLEKIPHSAVVNEAVNLIKASPERYNASFVNAVLRNLLRSDIPLPSGDDVKSVSVNYSCPEPITAVLMRDLGARQATEFLKNALKTPPIFAAINTNAISKGEFKEAMLHENIEAEATASEFVYKINTTGSLENTQAYKNGWFFVQDISCRQAIEMLKIGQTSRVLDLCAAPGGKSFAAALIANGGEVVSCDLYEQRVSLIKKGAKRLGIDNIICKTADATRFYPEFGEFDRIICDVPCSGLGVLRRKPDIKYKALSDFKELAEIQLKILDNAAGYLKPGGKLLYSTCTLNAEENGENVRSFLKTHTDWILETEHTFLPSENNGDGFYAAVLCRKSL